MMLEQEPFCREQELTPGLTQLQGTRSADCVGSGRRLIFFFFPGKEETVRGMEAAGYGRAGTSRNKSQVLFRCCLNLEPCAC